MIQHEDTLAVLVTSIALLIMPPNPKTTNIDKVRIINIMGGSLANINQGMVFGREPEGTLMS